MTDHLLIQNIATRASALFERITGKAVKPEFIASELWLVHSEVISLRLQELLDAEDIDFAHDIGGIHRHLEIGKPCTLSHGFTPRFAKWG
jgi:hypothetical protein